ncbi:MAG: hypothetical protein HN650_15195, partial [Rhodospirillaceae bacterium]|nr:hypothetical protein [Rhodospirillaceae bacterium]
MAARTVLFGQCLAFSRIAVGMGRHGREQNSGNPKDGFNKSHPRILIGRGTVVKRLRNGGLAVFRLPVGIGLDRG